MTGKQKCKILKEIRRQIAEQNEIRFIIEECSHKGKCRGTCPKCEWEVRMLEKELEKRRAAGKKIALAGISAGFLLTSCSPIEVVKDMVSSVVNPLAGDMITEITEGAIAESEKSQEIAPETETLEGEPALPEVEIEEGEVLPEEETELAGVPMPLEETEEYVLEGDIVCPVPEEEDTP